MPNVTDELDWQIYFAKNNDCTDRKDAVPFSWTDSKEPLTFRNAYPYLKSIFESEKPKKKAKTEFKQGHRKKMFTQEQAEKMVKLKEQGLSNVKIGEAFHCSERTVRNYLKSFRN